VIPRAAMRNKGILSGFYKSEAKLIKYFLIYLRRICSNSGRDGQKWNIDREERKTKDNVQKYNIYNCLPTP
jgi:hypothetical protein